MKLKLVEVGGKKYAEVDDQSMPVYVHDDGKEIGFDAKGARDRITALNAENKESREKREVAEGQLKVFAGIDPEAAKKAIETMKNIDESKLLAADKVQEIKDAAKRTAEEAVAAANAEASKKLQAMTDENASLTGRLHKQMLGAAFGGSKFVQEKLVLPVDLAMQSFGSHFKIEDDAIVAYYDDKNKVFSRKDHGTPAKFEEALEIIVDRYPNKDRILKAPNGGSGFRGGKGGNGGEDLSKLPPVERMKRARAQSS